MSNLKKFVSEKAIEQMDAAVEAARVKFGNMVGKNTNTTTPNQKVTPAEIKRRVNEGAQDLLKQLLRIIHRCGGIKDVVFDTYSRKVTCLQLSYVGSWQGCGLGLPPLGAWGCYSSGVRSSNGSKSKVRVSELFKPEDSGVLSLLMAGSTCKDWSHVLVALRFIVFPQAGLPVRGSYSFERGA